MAQKAGRSTVMLDSLPSVAAYAAAAGKKEGEGPLAGCFDMIFDDARLGEETWEKAESRMLKETVARALHKGGLSPGEIDYIFAGDLLNQCISSHYGLRDLGIPFYGLYGACSTMAEGLSLAALFVECGLAERAMAATSSHFCSAERQFRMPLEYGGQRPPTSQWTATAAGALVMGRHEAPPFVRAVCAGTITDLGIRDINNMGAAMAPAAARTIEAYLQDSGTAPQDYDLILTGDLGVVGSTLLAELLRQDGIEIGGLQDDCGKLLFDLETQDVHAGASGAGCSAAVLCSWLLPQLREGALQNVLFLATGALMSTTSFQQGESIPAIAHLVHLQGGRGKK